MQETEFEIDRDAVRRYFMAVLVLLCIVLPSFFIFFPVSVNVIEAVVQQKFNMFVFFILCSSLCVVFGIVFALIYAYGRWICPLKANSLRYRLVGSTLRADDGVFFLSRKSIPLERIADVVLVQGPLLRFFNIWTMQIKTVGSQMPEATLYGVREPESIRELILAQRRSGCCEKSEGI